MDESAPAAWRGEGRDPAFTDSLRNAIHNREMYTRIDRAHRALPVILGAMTLASAAVLLAWDADGRLFGARAHDILAAFALALIAIAYLVYQTAHRPGRKEAAKAILLAAAFLFWAANQFWPDSRGATLFNDIAIALFVLDVFLVMVGWPATSPDEAFAETYVAPREGESGIRRKAGSTEGGGAAEKS